MPGGARTARESSRVAFLCKNPDMDTINIIEGARVMEMSDQVPSNGPPNSCLNMRQTINPSVLLYGNPVVKTLLEAS